MGFSLGLFVFVAGYDYCANAVVDPSVVVKLWITSEISGTKSLTEILFLISCWLLYNLTLEFKYFACAASFFLYCLCTTFLLFSFYKGISLTP